MSGTTDTPQAPDEVQEAPALVASSSEEITSERPPVDAYDPYFGKNLTREDFFSL